MRRVVGHALPTNLDVARATDGGKTSSTNRVQAIHTSISLSKRIAQHHAIRKNATRSRLTSSNTPMTPQFAQFR